VLAALVTAAALAGARPSVPEVSLRQAQTIVEGFGKSLDDADQGAHSAAVVGDVNGDGHADLALTIPRRGIAVLFGPLAHGSATIAARLAKGRGFEIIGPKKLLVAIAAGDVNGDGLADVLVRSGDERGEAPGLPAYVVFGRRGGGSVDLARLGSRGFAIQAPTRDWSVSVAAGKDVNGDGRDDIAIGVPSGSFGHAPGGNVFVVFGRTRTAPVRLDALGPDGYRIDGPDGQSIGFPVALIDDVNGDRRAEVALVRNYHRPFALSVTYGRTVPGVVDLDSLAGFTVDTGGPGDIGQVSPAGDVNGDGRGDLLLGVSIDIFYGSAYVVLSTGGDVDLADPAAPAYSFPPPQGDCYYPALADVGDVDRDGRPDALVGCAQAETQADHPRGGAYLLFGRSSPAAVPDPAAIHLDSPAAHCSCHRRSAFAGADVSGGADVDGDGRADLVVSTEPEFEQGAVYVLGVPRILRGTPVADTLTGSAGPDLILGLGGNDRILGGGGSDTIEGGAGNDTVDGGAGSDRLVGGSGSDVLSGGAGADDLLGQAGNDALRGGEGDDYLAAGAGDDRVDGGPGNEVAFGEAGADRVAGGPGADLLFGDGLADYAWTRPPDAGAGRDTILGGRGRDLIWGGGGLDAIDGGPGIDTGDGKLRARDHDRVSHVERRR
jgi:Ca2+-binding RTX toxin-like protein